MLSISEVPLIENVTCICSIQLLCVKKILQCQTRYSASTLPASLYGTPMAIYKHVRTEIKLRLLPCSTETVWISYIINMLNEGKW